jgi:hypothetical protein
LPVLGFSIEAFERQAEGLLRQRAWRQLQVLAGHWPTPDLATLYDEDFPNFTSFDYVADLRGVDAEDPRNHRHLVGLAASALLEGRTVPFAEQAASFQATTLITLPEAEVRWRLAPERWRTLEEVGPRHELQDGWREPLERLGNHVLDRWQGELLDLAARRLEVDDLISFWDEQRDLNLTTLTTQANTLLGASSEQFGHVLGVYLGQRELPVDDAWRCDVDFAFRAPQFDAAFPILSLVPAVIGTLQELGIDAEAQAGLRLDLDARPAKAGGLHCVPLGVPEEVHVLLRPIGGYLDYQRLLRGLGMAEHLLLTDRTLPFDARWLGDASLIIASGLLLERLTLEPVWLRERLELETIDDYRVVSHLAWLARVRGYAARLAVEQELWRGGPEAANLGADYEEIMSRILRYRPFGGERYTLLFDAPWSTLQSAVWLRAELFAAQLVAYLRREFDAEWWRTPRAARFLVEELWRPGRRYTAEELLGFMGDAGFDAGVLWREIDDVLRPV